ncbi:hypothetical protein TrLO_g7914 [Triparma laevis f. longispina]|uniref:TauD/TfdA-like domain-containing protein n=1 Tax=Triparma laevis f. longispina TaxID=1714387 RepID=A0A9W7FU92_9STRA|nr:hypothetical protein TrLO_g7914 [Triparma laevis f. longispina]
MRLTISALLLPAAAGFFMPTPTVHLSAPLRSTLAPPEPQTETTETPLSPLTQWGSSLNSITSLQENARSMSYTFPKTIDKKELAVELGNCDDEIKWVKENAMGIKDAMVVNGAVVFRNFESMKTQPGFTEFYETLGMHPCLDPLHSVSARPTIEGSPNSKPSAVYEAVNKESRKNFFIGMHNEFVGTRAPRAAAFVCFKKAEKGGEFLIADGRRIFREIDPEVMQRLYNRSIRYSVMELPFFGWVDSLPSALRPSIMGALKGLASFAINAKVDFSVELLEQVGGYDNTRLLQARAPKQPPVVEHPVSGEATWFCNVHSHSSKLRKEREAIYGAEKFEDGASRINKSDMFYGDDGHISDSDLKHLDEVTNNNIQYIEMNEGDVVLLDNYKTMHGRNVFDGKRKHGVCWFGGWEGEEEQKKRQWDFGV